MSIFFTCYEFASSASWLLYTSWEASALPHPATWTWRFLLPYASPYWRRCWCWTVPYNGCHYMAFYGLWSIWWFGSMALLECNLLNILVIHFIYNLLEIFKANFNVALFGNNYYWGWWKRMTDLYASNSA